MPVPWEPSSGLTISVALDPFPKVSAEIPAASAGGTCQLRGQNSARRACRASAKATLPHASCTPGIHDSQVSGPRFPAHAPTSLPTSTQRTAAGAFRTTSQPRLSAAIFNTSRHPACPASTFTFVRLLARVAAAGLGADAVLAENAHAVKSEMSMRPSPSVSMCSNNFCSSNSSQCFPSSSSRKTFCKSSCAILPSPFVSSCLKQSMIASGTGRVPLCSTVLLRCTSSSVAATCG
mmetsp:Transcript_96075/g.184582  ORF Transcript_96075/g.184582 Transcript_96075/m.184582 type:complete len:235 (+) Transcript_96075:81-785(+)